MKRLRNILFFLLLVQNGYSQLQIKVNSQPINYKASGIEYRFDNCISIADSPTSRILQRKWEKLNSNKINLNKLTQSIWLKIPINQLAQEGEFSYLNINNPHINFLECSILNDTGIVKHFTLTGDNLPFQTRSIPITSFDFPINSNNYKNCYILLIADKKYTNLSLPILFYSANNYIAKIEMEKAVIGIIIGVCVFILLLNVFLFLVIRQSLFLWYGLYIFFILIYLLTDNGILFKILYPNYPSINDLIRPFTLAISFIPMILFFNKLIDFKQYFPTIYKINKWFIALYIPVFLIAIITTASGNYELQGKWLQVNRILSPLLMVFLLSESIYCFSKNAQYSFFPFLTLTGTTVFVIIFSLHQNALIEDNWFTAKSIYFGIVWEFVSMSLSLIWRYKYYKIKSESLLQKNQEQQERILIETAAFQEKEMQKISSILHDTVGASLGLLRIEADNMKLTNEDRSSLANNITRLGQEVRILSHNFSPILLHEKGLFFIVEEMVNRIKAHSAAAIQFEWIGEKDQIKPQYEIIIYRIVQEMIQNILKHSAAQNAFLQILVEQNLISIYSENDVSNSHKFSQENGVGLKSIEKLVNLLNGSFKVRHKENDSFSISIEFNQDQHEKI